MVEGGSLFGIRMPGLAGVRRRTPIPFPGPGESGAVRARTPKRPAVRVTCARSRRGVRTQFRFGPDTIVYAQYEDFPSHAAPPSKLRCFAPFPPHSCLTRRAGWAKLRHGAKQQSRRKGSASGWRRSCKSVKRQLMKQTNKMLTCQEPTPLR